MQYIFYQLEIDIWLGVVPVIEKHTSWLGVVPVI